MIPLSMEARQNTARGWLNSFLHSFRRRAGTPSGPGEQFPLNSSNASSRSTLLNLAHCSLGSSFQLVHRFNLILGFNGIVVRIQLMQAFNWLRFNYFHGSIGSTGSIDSNVKVQFVQGFSWFEVSSNSRAHLVEWFN